MFILRKKSIIVILIICISAMITSVSYADNVEYKQADGYVIVYPSISQYQDGDDKRMVYFKILNKSNVTIPICRVELKLPEKIEDKYTEYKLLYSDEIGFIGSKPADYKFSMQDQNLVININQFNSGESFEVYAGLDINVDDKSELEYMIKQTIQKVIPGEWLRTYAKVKLILIGGEANELIHEYEENLDVSYYRGKIAMPIKKQIEIKLGNYGNNDLLVGSETILDNEDLSEENIITQKIGKLFRDYVFKDYGAKLWARSLLAIFVGITVWFLFIFIIRSAILWRREHQRVFDESKRGFR